MVDLFANSRDPVQTPCSVVSDLGLHCLPDTASVAQLDVRLTGDQEVVGSTPHPRGWQHSSVEIDHEIFSTVILSLALIQEGQLSVSAKRMCTILVNPFKD